MVEKNDDLSALDFAVVLAENWLALLLVPIVVAAGAYFVSSSAPQTYRATVELVLPQTEEIDGPEQPDGFTNTNAVYRAALLPREGVLAKITEGGVTITAEAASTQEASVLALSVYSEAIAPVVAWHESSMNAADAIIAQIEPLIDPVMSAATENPSSAIAVANLLDTVSSQQSRAADAALALQSLQVEPNVTTSRKGLSPLVVAVIAGLLASVVLLLALALREGLRGAATTEKGRQQIARIRSGLLLRRR